MKKLQERTLRFRAIQTEIRQNLSLQNEITDIKQIKYIAGADVSYSRFSKIGHAGIVVMTYPELEIIERVSFTGTLDVPYIPGFLAFREWPLLKPCLDQLTIQPDLLICDGQGYAHPKRVGLAVHIGVMSGLVTIGCAKTRLVGEYSEPAPEKGSVSDLIHEDEKIGEVLRTRKNIKPLFISPGHRIDFATSTRLILDLCRQYRQPEPIRAAHHFVNKVRRNDQD